MKTPYGVAGKPQRLSQIPWDYVDEFKDRVPFYGLHEYWYPVFRSSELHHNEPKPFTLLGEDLVFFRDELGKPRALHNVCPHRGAMLSLGQVGVYRPGTLTCRYHGATFDGTGQCLAFLTDGPNSSMTERLRARAYPIEELAGMIWVYMGQKKPAPVFECVPHAREALSEPWKYYLYWEFPVNYLQVMDNLADALHPSIAHSTCAHFHDQKLWDKVKSTPLECGGLHVSLSGVGPPNRGTRSMDSWELHLPSYMVFTHVTPSSGPAPSNHGGLFYVIPLDIGSTRLMDMTSFGGPILRRTKDRIKFQLLGHKWGLPNSIYYCNLGPDQALLVSQGRIADRRKEHWAPGDQPVGKFRRMLAEAYAAEKVQQVQSDGVPDPYEPEPQESVPASRPVPSTAVPITKEDRR